jgi:hypothetical protein
MKKLVNPIATAFLILALLSFAGAEALAQTPSIGVSTGDTFTYVQTFFWNSTDEKTVPSASDVASNGSSYEIKITGVNGSSVNFETKITLKNGSVTSNPGQIDLETGVCNSKIGYIIVGAGLGPNDTVHSSSLSSPATPVSKAIDDTTMRSYLNGQRETNHLTSQGVAYYDYYTASGDFRGGNLIFHQDSYFDKKTGMLVEYLRVVVTVEAGGWPMTNETELLLMSGSSLWDIAETSSTPSFSPSASPQPYPFSVEILYATVAAILLVVVIVAATLAFRHRLNENSVHNTS